MKAYVLHNINDFRLENVKKPVPTENHVLVQVKAAGICGSDIPRVFRTGTYHYPLIPGHEFSGVVTEVGEGVSHSWIGKSVGVFPMIPCKQCQPCRDKKFELCEHYSYLGSRTDGGFAEFVQVPVWNLLELDHHVSMVQAAMLEPMAVAVHAIRQSKLVPENTIAVCGLGTIGLLVVMFLREMGCKKVYAIGNKHIQQRYALQLGVSADEFCNIHEQDVSQWLKEKTSGRGVDVFFECVGKNETLNQALANVAASGTVQLVGNPAGDMSLEKSLYWKILRKQISIYGTWNSSFTHEQSDDWHYVLSRLASNRIHPELIITHRLKMDDLMHGFNLMHDKSEEYIKVMAEF